jgi:hypothetical protein
MIGKVASVSLFDRKKTKIYVICYTLSVTNKGLSNKGADKKMLSWLSTG